MKIYPVFSYNKNIFKSRVIMADRFDMPKDIYDKIDVFEETHSNAKLLGRGCFASAYLLGDTGYVIKESLPDEFAKNQNNNFIKEANALKMIPSSIEHTQKFVERVRTEKEKDYLLSTYVSGKPAKYPENPWTKDALGDFFNTLFSLDKAGIYHNDLNKNNCLINENGQVNIIDYQFAEKFIIDDSKNNDKILKTPPFMMPSNLQMFEMAALPKYIKSIGRKTSKNETRNFFKNYLKEKSNYAKNRELYLKEHSNDFKKAEYERLQAKFFSNPSEDMIDLQAKKLQVLYSFRKAFSNADPNRIEGKNVASAIPAYINTAACAKDMIKKAKSMKKHPLNKDLNSFLDFEIKFGEYWQNTMINEFLPYRNSSFDWIERNAQLSPRTECRYLTEEDGYYGYESYPIYFVPFEENLSEKFRVSKNLKFGSVNDIGGMIANNSNSPEAIECSVNLIPIKEKTNRLEEQIKNNNEYFQYENMNSEIIDYFSNKQKFIEHSKNIISAVNKNRLISAIPNAIMSEYYGKLAQKALSSISYIHDNKDFIKRQENILNTDTVSEILKIAVKLMADSILSSKRELLLEDVRIFDF